MLQNAPLLVIVGVGTAENDLSKVSLKIGVLEWQLPGSSVDNAFPAPPHFGSPNANVEVLSERFQDVRLPKLRGRFEGSSF